MKEQIIKILGVGADIENFASYCVKVQTEKTKEGKIKNIWATTITAQTFSELYRRIESLGLIFDGKHITLQSTGITFDYIAYKNKMLLTYPESKIDVNVVLIGDEFSCSKDNGKVTYSHKITNPFSQTNDKNIEGAYCVIKNDRGEYITTLGADEIEKHRKIAKTDFMWRDWFREMVLKTIIKKACKLHFDDVYSKVEEIDNENYDLDIPVNIELDWKKEIDEIQTLERLKHYWSENQGRGKEFNQYVTMRKAQIQNGTN